MWQSRLKLQHIHFLLLEENTVLLIHAMQPQYCQRGSTCNLTNSFFTSEKTLPLIIPWQYEVMYLWIESFDTKKFLIKISGELFLSSVQIPKLLLEPHFNWWLVVLTEQLDLRCATKKCSKFIFPAGDGCFMFGTLVVASWLEAKLSLHIKKYHKNFIVVGTLQTDVSAKR